MMQNDTEIRNCVRISDTRIDCEILHPVFGWVPFTADANDFEPHGRALYAAAVKFMAV